VGPQERFRGQSDLVGARTRYRPAGFSPRPDYWASSRSLDHARRSEARLPWRGDVLLGQTNGPSPRGLDPSRVYATTPALEGHETEAFSTAVEGMVSSGETTPGVPHVSSGVRQGCSPPIFTDGPVWDYDDRRRSGHVDVRPDLWEDGAGRGVLPTMQPVRGGVALSHRVTPSRRRARSRPQHRSGGRRSGSRSG